MTKHWKHQARDSRGRWTSSGWSVASAIGSTISRFRNRLVTSTILGESGVTDQARMDEAIVSLERKSNSRLVTSTILGESGVNRQDFADQALIKLRRK